MRATNPPGNTLENNNVQMSNPPPLSIWRDLRDGVQHVWEAPQKKACLKWCKECSKSNKRLLKELISLENKRIEEEKRAQQVSSEESNVRGGKKEVLREFK